MLRQCLRFYRPAFSQQLIEATRNQLFVGAELKEQLTEFLDALFPLKD